MISRKNSKFTRRDFLKATGAAAAALAASPLINACANLPAAPASPAESSESSSAESSGNVEAASSDPLRIGVLLTYSDIYAVLGESITEAMRMYFEEVENQAGGRQIELIIEDDELNPDVAQQKARKLVEQDEVDFVTGIISSGVLVALRDYFEETRTLLLCSNAGANELSRGLKTPYIWRTSFTNWMPNWPVGTWAAENVGMNAYISVPDYAAGENTITSFTDSFEAAGGTVAGVQRTPFPNMGDPAPFIAELADAAPDLVYCFYSGGAAVTFVQAYGDFGLSGQIPLMCSGFMVEEDVLPAQGEAALGTRSGLHWSLLLENEANQAFTQAYKERTEMDANVFAVQGYDTARLIVEMVNMVNGDTSNVDSLIETLPAISFESPRGPFALDENSQAPRQNIYLREVQEVDGALHNVVIENLGEIVDPGDDSKG